MASGGENGTEERTETSTPAQSIANAVSETTHKVIGMDKDGDMSGVPAKKSRVEVQSLPTRQYLDQTCKRKQKKRQGKGPLPSIQ